jgi:4-amino-4-deoxy-L-arabinose transferase-like glycosyltransferase
MTDLQTYRKLLWIIILVAFAVRVAVRCYSGAENFWVNGYGFFFEFAQNIAAGNGIAFSDGPPTVFRVPLYPLFLAAVTFGQKAFLPIVLAQSLIGAGTVWCAALIAREMFGSAAAIIAAIVTALYPYYVVHDTALQETSLYTFLTTLAVLLLLRARRSRSGMMAGCAGLTLGAAVLARATLAPFAFLAPLWLAIPGVFCSGPWRQGCWAAVICGSAVALTLSPWLVRSYALTGSPVLSTDIGYQLWVGNNPYTFSHYPSESIDLSRDTAFEALGPQEKADIKAIGTGEVAFDRWFRRKGIEYIHEHPWWIVTNAFRKVGASFGWLPSPRRSFWSNIVHSLAYGFVMTLGIWGMWAFRRYWREHLIYYLLFISFVGVTALFYGHTSHRAYLDVYLIVFAVGALEQLRNRYFPRSTSRPSNVPIQSARYKTQRNSAPPVAFSASERRIRAPRRHQRHFANSY